MMQVLPVMLTLYSVLIPTKTWYTPSEPLMMQLKGGADVSLVAVGARSAARRHAGRRGCSP